MAETSDDDLIQVRARSKHVSVNQFIRNFFLDKSAR